MANTTQYLQVGDFITNIIDSATGESTNYEKVTTWADGTSMDDSKCDGVIYRKLPDGGGYVKRVFPEGLINVTWFGAKGDGVNDDTVAIQSALDVAGRIRTISTISSNMTVILPRGYNFRTSDTLFVPPYIDLDMQSRVAYTGTKDRPALVIGNASDTSRNTTLNISVSSTPRASDGWNNPEHVGVRLINTTSSIITITVCDGFYKGVECLGDTAGYAYNTMFIKQINSCKYSVYLDFKNGGWCNENKFFGGRFSTNTGFAPGVGRVGARITGDDNVFYSPSFELHYPSSLPEASQAAVFDDAYQCRILHCRNEGNSSMSIVGAPFPAFVINGNSQGNIIDVGYCYDRVTGLIENAFQDNSVTKQNIYKTAINLFEDAEFGRPIYYSGNIAERASLYSANQVFVPGLRFISHTSGTISDMSFSDTEGASVVDKNDGPLLEVYRSGIAISLSTRNVKKFAVVRDGHPALGGQVGVKCYDAGGNEITSNTEWAIDDQLSGGVPNQTFSYSSQFGGCYLTGTPAPSNIPVYFSVKNNVDRIVLFIASPGGRFRLRSFSVLSLDNVARASTDSSSSTYRGEIKRVSALPVRGTYRTGEILVNRLSSRGENTTHFCTASGTLTAISATGDVQAGNATISNVTNIGQFNVGDFLTIQNATGPQYFVTHIDATSNSITVNTSTGLVSGTGLTITNQPPTFLSAAPAGVTFSGGPSPEGSISAGVGSTYNRLSQGGGSQLWLKQTGTGNTGWAEVQVARSGATGARPTGATTGFMYFDTTLNIPVWYDGTNWVDATGTTV